MKFFQPPISSQVPKFINICSVRLEMKHADTHNLIFKNAVCAKYTKQTWEVKYFI